MCAKVKAEVQNIAGELVVSGLDSATSLIQVKYHGKIRDSPTAGGPRGSNWFDILLVLFRSEIPGQTNELSLIDKIDFRLPKIL